MKTEKQIRDYLAICKNQHEYNKKNNNKYMVLIGEAVISTLNYILEESVAIDKAPKAEVYDVMLQLHFPE